MENIKEMPYHEKYEILLDNIEISKTLIPDFIEGHVGHEPRNELQMKQQEGIQPIPEEASFKDKYETAYENWIWMGKSGLKFIREQMGEEGIELYERTEVEMLKRENASPSLYFLSFLRVISTGTAFKMTTKEFAYRLQWLTPFSVKELNQHQTVFDIPRCKILDYPETDDLCQIAC